MLTLSVYVLYIQLLEYDFTLSQYCCNNRYNYCHE